jgi:perosamine synthetase
MSAETGKTDLVEEVIAAVRAVVGLGPVGLHEPQFKGNEWLYLKECLDTGFVSSVGKFVDRFEAELAAYTGAKYAIAVVNGTAALHTSLILAGVESDDEVLVPTLTFVATANAVRYCGATPHFVDSEESTLGMATESLREYLGSIAEQRNGLCVNVITGKVIRAMVPMHAFGHPADLDGLLSIARDFNLALIEDAAESLGSYYHGRHTGTFGLMGTLSFNGNKVLTTGGGGAILTDDSVLARRAKHLTTTAKLPHRWAFEHDEVGYNYRMPNINAALGCAQLELLPDFLAAKRRLHSRYRDAFSCIRHARLMVEPNSCQSNYWLQTLLLDDEVATQRNAVLEGCNDAGFMARPAWDLMHRMNPYRNCPRSPLMVAESLGRRIINIPSSAFLV